MGVFTKTSADATDTSVVEELKLLLGKATTGTDGRKEAAAEFAAKVKQVGAQVLSKKEVFDELKKAATSKGAMEAREGCMFVLEECANSCGHSAEPHLVKCLPLALALAADKKKECVTAGAAASKAIVTHIDEYAVRTVLPYIFGSLSFDKKFQEKVAALNLLEEMTKTAPVQVTYAMEIIIPAVTEVIGDVKKQVKEASVSALEAVMSVVGNKDIEPFIPSVVKSIADPSTVPECVHKLAATTFVQEVKSPALSLMVPLLSRGLRNTSDTATAIKRKSCTIVDNMCKLVEDPKEVYPFLGRIMSEVKTVSEEVSDPECRNVATKALKTLTKVAGEAGQLAAEGVEVQNAAVTPEETGKDLLEVLATVEGSTQGETETLTKTVDASDDLEYVASVCATLINQYTFEYDIWHKVCTTYLSGFISDEGIESVCRAFLAKCEKAARSRQTGQEAVEEEGEVLCDCEFSLAYGAMILLNNTKLKLRKGKRYGLCGPNGCGKSTLMKAIANEQVDGFPPKTELRTVYVEHDIQGAQDDVAVVEFVISDPFVADRGKTTDEIKETLSSVGFTDEMQGMPIRALSGGWKMKLALARAMLGDADIFLLDEPTNHLDVTNVQWLCDYLNSQTRITSMIVSHDSSFLDRVCTGIIHYENRKLKTYIGNLAEFVKQKPEAKSYYELANDNLKFIFPEPGFLEGVKNKDKAIVKVMNCDFAYPGMEKNIINDARVQLSLSSRVACIGPNGAGKSTLIKMITGETEPVKGTVWKHENMRIAYVAQHAFHHIEKHLDKTPNQYIQWRYAAGEDREGIEKATRQVSEEEKKALESKVAIDGDKRQVEALVARRKLKGVYQYEVQWKGAPPDQTSWVARTKLEELGFQKMIKEIDEKEAAAQGLQNRPLTQSAVEKHLDEFGLDAEFGTHNLMKGLSGGQKVKVVLAAAMWCNPHILVLDEPTNYLDRDALGALAMAIKDYNGGVVVISHNNEFCRAVCPETWTVGGGVVQVEGGPQPGQAKEKIEWKAEEDTIDALGNTVKAVKRKVKLSRKELKAKQRARAAKIKAGEPVSDESDEEWPEGL